MHCHGNKQNFQNENLKYELIMGFLEALATRA
jgi:hypothetical protein